MEISIISDVTHHPSTTSPLHQLAMVATSTAQDLVLDQFQQMRSTISSFLHVKTWLLVQDSCSATIATPRLSTLKRETFQPSLMRQWSFWVKYSTRPKKARDRSLQVNRSPHFNFQKQHRPQQDENIYSEYLILNQSLYQLCSLIW